MLEKVLATLLLGLIVSEVSSDSSITCAKSGINGNAAYVVTVNLNDPDVKVSVALAKGGTGKSEAFSSTVTRTRPMVAITGTFFDTKTLIPTGDIAISGTIVHSGCIGSALCIDANNKAAIVALSVGRKQRWAGYETVLCAGPTIIRNGKVSIALKHEGFRKSLLTPTQRTAVGITSSGKILIVAVKGKTSLYAVAKLMLRHKAIDAVCLDGGSSTGLYANGRYLAVPSRMLTNSLVVYAKTKDYENAKRSLVSASLYAKICEQQTQQLAELYHSNATSAEQLVSADLRMASMTSELATASLYGSSNTSLPSIKQSVK